MATANLSDFKCNRCGDGHRLPKATKLAGEYHTSLCSPCLNDWAIAGRNMREWVLLQAAKASPEVLLALMCGSYIGDERQARVDYCNALLALDEAELAMHAAAKAWVTAGVPNA